MSMNVNVNVNKKIVRMVMLSLLLLAVASAVLPASASLSPATFMAFKDLRVGMAGVGKTTIRGDQVQLFYARIIGLIDNPGELNDYILVRSSGDLIREAGGYALGMSGSPIYINDRLIGAFFAAFLYDESPNPIGLVRPIETMLKLLESVQKAASGQSTSFQAPKDLEQVLKTVELEDGKKEVVFVSWPPELEERRAHPKTVYAVRTGTPLWVGGLSGRALEVLKQGLNPQMLAEYASSLLPLATPGFLEELERGFEERYETTIYPFAQAPSQPREFIGVGGFEPGRPMAALLTNGDVLFGGVCTTTYVDQKAKVLLACGHPLFFTGEASLFLAQASIIDTVNSAPISFVLPQVERTEVLGAVLQDRLQAIGAALDYQLPAIRLTSHLKDVSTDATRDFTVNMAPSRDFVPFLVFASLLQAVDTTLNRIGRGTMRIEYTIRGTEMAKKLERSDVFVSFSDIAVPGPLQVAQVVFLLSQNEFLDPGLERVDVEIFVTDAIRLLEVKSIETDKEAYKPGETVRYAIKLRTYRGPDRKVIGSFKLPEDLKVKSLIVHVFGGPRKRDSQPVLPEVNSLTELIEAIESLTTNDQLTVELLGLPEEEEEEGEGKSFQDIKKLKDWVVTGESRTTIQIELPKKPEEESKGKDEEEKSKPKCSPLYYC